MIKRIISILCIFLVSWQTQAYAFPFRCDAGSVYDNKNSCEAFCSDMLKLPCEEIEPLNLGEPCDSANYRGFVYIDGKTFAVTKKSVNSGWAANAAIIRNAVDNTVITGILKSEGIPFAWIGVSDPFKTSTAYDSVDSTRFKWKDGSSISYSSWEVNQPDNAFNRDAVGVSSLYGEYWVIMNQNGEWSDVGLNADGSDKLFPAIVEWNGALSCVAGKDKDVSDIGKPSGMVCGKEDDKLGFNFQSCTEGGIFGGGSGFLCPIEKTACNRNENEIIKVEHIETALTFPSYSEYRIKNPKPAYTQMETNFVFSCYENTNGMSFTSSLGEYSPLFYNTDISNSNGIVTVTINGYQYVTPAYAACSGATQLNYPPYVKSYPIAESKEIVSSALTFNSNETYTVKEGESVNIPANGMSYIDIINLNYSATIRNRSKEVTYSCPYSGKACIESDNGYFCSPNDCADGEGGGNYQPNPDETPEGANDADNNGAVDSKGNCLDRITIFPGEDSRCRQPGTQSSHFQCCKVIEPDEANKPDFHLPKLAVVAMLYFSGLGGIAALFMLVGPDGFDFKVCTGKERQLWVNRGNDLCYEVGSYCAEKWQGSGCVQRKKTFCCFDSDFSRAFNEAGVEMLGRNWGTAESPKCGGFTPEELQTLSAMNISDHPKMRDFADKLGEEYSNKMQKEFEKMFNKDSLEGKIKEQVERLQ